MATNSNNVCNPTNTSNTPINSPGQMNEQPANLNQIGSLATNILNNLETNNLTTTLRLLPSISIQRPLTKEDAILEEKENFEKSLNDWLNDSSALGNKDVAARRIREAYNNKSTYIALSELNLTSLPASIGNLTALTWLYLSKNQLTSIPPTIGNLTALKLIDLRSNNLTSLPTTIGNLTALTWLDLFSNKLTSLPTSFGNLTVLTKLHLSFNKLTSIPDSFGNLTYLTELELDNNKLTSIPDSFGSLSALSKLELDNNKLTSIPDSFGNLTSLTELDLSSNKLISLPDSIGNLTALTELQLHYNNLTSIPDSIGNLTALTGLKFYSNQLTSIPASIGNLTALKKLDLSSNKLTSIPDSIGNLTTLTELALSRNQLTSIPIEIGNLLALTDLWIKLNPLLRELPLSVGNIPGITYIDNKETQITQEMIDSILTLCRSHRDQEALNVLPTRLEAWKAYAKGNASLNYDLNFILQFDESEKRNINEWLERLSKTQDFRFQQQELASLVCSILETLQENRPFREIFFAQITGDFDRCDDRTAQSFNETYTSWKLHTLSELATLKEKLALLSGLAKTGELRDTIKKTIEREHPNYFEQVELVLYFENILKDQLGLVSAIQQRHYTPPQESLRWFNVDELEKTVKNNYKTTLVRSLDFQKLALQDNSFVEKNEEIRKEFDKKMSQLEQDNKEAKISEGAYLIASTNLKTEREKALDILAINWFDEQSKKTTPSN